MKKVTIIMTIMVLGLTGSALAGPNMQDGMWEITSTAEMPGMPFKMPATSYQQCITQNDLVPQQNSPQQKCEMLENHTDGDTVTWKIRCKSEGGDMTSEGRITYHGDIFEGEINTTGDQLPGGMKQTMSGKRTGECR